ncbi:hypothetical protein GCM10010329_41200 [Streptomyces spiroverticillatus]|uniref:SWIM-type domain-containing protein n=1 Tax=Streptomyces finlayi TaxID=67296 RepID=A0A919CAQ9_9ACTN|nr:hypothetical protein [Streptomyces finlayi]GHA14071.1 hypothetical protein GCM10010329_41200 [Streptomyces spiroverticillatus]GHC97543.1 hypothetical protein GCM10010334_39040 [Streptomyces finlayi]
MTTEAVARADLLALSPDTLASLANRGLVKRAAKDLDAGAGPVVSVAEDGRVRAVFEDGTESELPPGAGLDPGHCTCAAPGVCRHLVGLVLAYQRTATEAADPPHAEAPGSAAPWSPGGFDDEALRVAVGARSLASARRTFLRGYTAEVHPGTSTAPEPWVELPTCTVRFPVPGEIGYALTDASPALRGEMLALAVWAFRAADAQETLRAATRLEVGGSPHPSGTALTALDRAVTTVNGLLADGVPHAGPLLGGTLRQSAAALSAAGLHWPAGVVADLAVQVEAYGERSAAHRAEELASLVGELYARHRVAAVDPGAHADVLGVREAGETALRRVRLVSLGCRVSGSGPTTYAEVFFAHPDAGVVLVLRKEWTAADGTGDAPPGGPGVASRRVLGTTLRALASGSLISENARRTASRALLLGRSRVATTTVVPAGSAWTSLPDSLLVRDLVAHAVDWDRRPPRLLRPRVAAEAVRVVELSWVGPVSYDPAEQRLTAEVRDAAGNGALLGAGYDPLCPDALDVLADALNGDGGTRYVSGALSRAGGRIRITPLAVLTPGGVRVPDLSPAAPGSVRLSADGAAGSRTDDELTEAVGGALAALAEAAHHGLRNPPPSVLGELDDAAARLARCGLDRAAALVRAIPSALPQGVAAVRDAWVDAQIRLLVTAELHQGHGS